MKKSFSALTYMVAVLVFTVQANELQTITQLQWKNRLLIIWSEQPEKNYSQILGNFSEQIDDRDMVIFMINQSEMATNSSQKVASDLLGRLQRKFPRDDGRYFLVGKDGGLKSQGEVLEMESIFGEIDRMPMRKREVKNQSKQ